MNNNLVKTVAKVSLAVFFGLFLLGDFLRVIPLKTYWISMIVALVMFGLSYAYVKTGKEETPVNTRTLSTTIIGNAPYIILRILIAIFFIFFTLWSFYIGDWCLEIMRIDFIVLLIIGIVLYITRKPR